MWSLLLLAAVSNPHPGLTLVTRNGSAMVIANLCAPGVNVRATKYAERQATPQQWGQAVGVAAAINADFFDFPGWTLVNGRARGGGEDWPADKQYFESRSYWSFGLFNAGLVENAALAPPGLPWSTDIVGGHNVLIRGGQSLEPLFDGDAVITTAHRRTAIGMSRDKRTLFLYASNNSLTGTGIVAELRAMQAEAGAPAIDTATNMDGGGSSQLYVAGLGQIITSGRQVNNHLGVFASGSGPSYNCNNLPPKGTLDAVGCDGVFGWGQDPNGPAAPIDVYVSFNGGPFDPGASGQFAKASVKRDDLCTPLGSCEHAFAMTAPLSQLDGQPHPVRAWAMDSEGGTNTELEGSPKTFTCLRSAPAGVLRHVTGPPSLTAWQFSMFMDVQPVANLDGRQLAAPWPEAPQLIQLEGQREVWLVDGAWRRHVPDPEAAARWHLDLSKVVKVASSALPVGPALAARPWLVREGGGGIYVVDGAREEAVGARPVAAPSSPVGPQAAAGPGEPRDADPVAGGCSAAAGLTPLVLLTLLRAGIGRRRRTASR